MVNYTLILGTETTVHGQLHTYSGDRGCCSWSITHLFWAQRLLFMVLYSYSGDRGCCSWSITHLFWAQRPLFMVNYTLILGTEAAVHGQLHTKSGHRDCCSCSFTHLILGQFSSAFTKENTYFRHICFLAYIGQVRPVPNICLFTQHPSIAITGFFFFVLKLTNVSFASHD